MGIIYQLVISFGVKSELNLAPKNLFRCEDIQRQLRLCGDGVNKEATVISYRMNILSYELRGGTSVTVRRPQALLMRM